LFAVVAIVALSGPGGGLAAANGTGVTWIQPAPVWPLHHLACPGAITTTTTPVRTYLHAVSINGTEKPTYIGKEVIYRRSANLGKTWPAAVRLTSNRLYEICPTIAASGSTVVVAWEAAPVAGHSFIELRVSKNHGITWGPTRRMPAPVDAGGPSVAVTGTTIFVAWSDSTPDPRWSRIASSHDNGATWTLRRLDAKPARRGTVVAASGSTVITAWLRAPDHALIARLSLDGGATWQAPKVIQAPYPDNPQLQYSVAARPDRVAIAWSNFLDPVINVRLATMGVWAAPASVTAPPADPTPVYGYLHAPIVKLLADTRVGLAFAGCRLDAIDGTCEYAFTDTVDDVLWSESQNNGIGWTTPNVISPADSAADGRTWPHTNDISVAWTSRNLRAVLVSRASGDPDWFLRNFFTRGYGLP
jgi:hypothetical protein